MSDTLGIWLRRARESRQLDLADIEKRLRIRQRYLQALEVGDYTALPGEIQTRGFLRNYARFLGLPVEDVLSRYTAEVQGRPYQPRLPIAPEMPKGRNRERTWAPPPPVDDRESVPVEMSIPHGLIRMGLLITLLLALVALGSYIGLRLLEADSPDVSPGIPALSTPELNPAVPKTPTTTRPVFVPASDGTIRVVLLVKQHAWVSVSADQQMIFQGIAETDQRIEATANEILIVTTGNGGAFQLYLNGMDWGLLGEQGAAVRRAWSPQGEVNLEDS